MEEHVYGKERERGLLELLRMLSRRLDELDRDDQLLNATPELLKLLGNIRSELFHYEVRATYDTPEVADNRRIVESARQQAEQLEYELENREEDDEPWRRGNK